MWKALYQYEQIPQSRRANRYRATVDGGKLPSPTLCVVNLFEIKYGAPSLPRGAKTFQDAYSVPV
jgi:hypothetical protein